MKGLTRVLALISIGIGVYLYVVFCSTGMV